jgi:transcriptional regulator with XRE-family HTH domain
MLRYKKLLLQSVDPDNQHPMTMRELAKALKIPVPSVHNYIEYDTLPRIENIQKMATYYKESISSLFSEDDDTTAQLITTIRKLNKKDKQQLLITLK